MSGAWSSVAWAAGIFEGEGCIAYYMASGRWPTWKLAVEMTDEDVVRRFQQVVGGPEPRLKDSPSRRARRLTPIWRWQTSRRADVVRILEAFLPYLGERRRAKALEALEHTRGRIAARQAV